MGQAISAVLEASPECSVFVAENVGTTVADVVVDFSSPTGFDDALAYAQRNGCAFVSGSTGVTEEALATLDVAAQEIPVLWAANMSLGVAVTRALVRQAAAALPASFAPEILELHHRHKADAPSGTALALAGDVAGARTARLVHGRQGQVGARHTEELGMHAVRGGDVVGEHTVYFFGDGERVEITHRATDRMVFARGAVAAALWLVGRTPARYTMDDVLGLVPQPPIAS